MNLTKNIRISLYILVPILLWMISGFFKNDSIQEPIQSSELFNVQTVLSIAEEYQPYIKLKATTKSEKRINVKAKTSGEVVKIGAVQGQYVLSLIHISEPTRPLYISYAVFCLKKKKK